MNKFRLFYFIIAALVGFLIFMNFGLTGESGISTYYLTVALTFPIGLVVGYAFSVLSNIFNPNYVGLFFIPVAIIANYFQWVFFISQYRKWKTRSQSRKY